MQIPELVIFDMDGLLVDSERIYMDILADYMTELGYKWNEAHYLTTLGTALSDVIRTMQALYGEDFPYPAINEVCAGQMEKIAALQPLPVKKGIRELLSYLQMKDIPCCVASSSPRATVELYLNSAGLIDFFSYIIAGDEITRSKPDPQIFLACCRHFKVEPANALVLEDSENGIRAAVNGGIPVLCIPDLKTPDEKLLAKTAGVLDDAGKVIALLSHE